MVERWREVAEKTENEKLRMREKEEKKQNGCQWDESEASDGGQ